MTFVKIKNFWYKEVKYKENQDLETYKYLAWIDILHYQTLAHRLINNPDLYEQMTKNMNTVQEDLKENKILYINKYGAYYPFTNQTEIEDFDFSNTRPYLENEGLTGWLDSKGIFYECNYGAHSYCLDFFNIEKENAIYFACAQDTFGDLFESVTMDGNKLTKEQDEWLNQNFFALSEKQQDIVKTFS